MNEDPRSFFSVFVSGGGGGGGCVARKRYCWGVVLEKERSREMRWWPSS